MAIDKLTKIGMKRHMWQNNQTMEKRELKLKDSNYSILKLAVNYSNQDNGVGKRQPENLDTDPHSDAQLTSDRGTAASG